MGGLGVCVCSTSASAQLGGQCEARRRSRRRSRRIRRCRGSTFQHNSVGDGGAASLASALKENTTLQTLNLLHNSVGADGAASLASALKENTTLQTLNLWGNSVGDASAASLASALEESRRRCRRSALKYNWALVGAGGAESLRAIHQLGTDEPLRPSPSRRHSARKRPRR